MSSTFRALEPFEATACVSGGLSCLEFTNTVHNFGSAPLDDDLESYASLLAWARSRDVIDAGTQRQLALAAKRDPRAADTALGRARKLRAALYRVLSARSHGVDAPAADLESVNAVIRAAMAGSQLVSNRAALSWSWPVGHGIADAILWPIARSAAHLLTSDEADRIVECGGKTCTWLILDTTKNHSRKFCSAQGCGNRTRVARFYERSRASAS